MSLEFLIQSLENEVFRRLFNVGCDFRDALIEDLLIGRQVSDRSLTKLIGVVANLKETHRRAQFVQRSLREVGAWCRLQPLDCSGVGMRALERGLISIV